MVFFRRCRGNRGGEADVRRHRPEFCQPRSDRPHRDDGFLPHLYEHLEQAFYYLQSSSDALTTASPLAQNAAGEAVPSYIDLFLGLRAGCLGETCVCALLLGGVYLVARRVIKPVIPLCFIGTVFVFTWILGEDPVFQILSGGLMLGAFSWLPTIPPPP